MLTPRVWFYCLLTYSFPLAVSQSPEFVHPPSSYPYLQHGLIQGTATYIWLCMTNLAGHLVQPPSLALPSLQLTDHQTARSDQIGAQAMMPVLSTLQVNMLASLVSRHQEHSRFILSIKPTVGAIYKYTEHDITLRSILEH